MSLQAPIRPSPSLINNNLTATGGHLAYAHRAYGCILQQSSVTTSKPVQMRRVECQCQDVIHSVRALHHDGNSYLLLATEGGVQVWDRQGHHLLYLWTFPTTEKKPPLIATTPGASSTSSSTSVHGVDQRHHLFARGAAMAVSKEGTAMICFGSSSGDTYVMTVTGSSTFSEPVKCKHHNCPITAIGSAYQSRHGRRTNEDSECLVTADELGRIAVWTESSGNAYTWSHDLPSPPSSSSSGSGTGDWEGRAPAVSLAVRGDAVVAARLDGCIHVYSLEKKCLLTEIVAHSRWLTCMDIHPTKDLIVTGAEDGTLAVWSLPIGAQKVAALLSAMWMHASITGVAFCGSTLDDVAAVAYDTDEIQIYKLKKPS